MKTLCITTSLLLLWIADASGATAMKSIPLNQLLAATGGDAFGFDREAVEFPAVGIDSRTIRPGELFWAVRGTRHDGHDYLGAAFNRGAAACVVQSDKVQPAAGPLVVVEDTLQALWDLARWYRAQQAALVIGVTGSVGKTTAREMIHAVLSADHSGTQSPRNYNNHFGVPLSLLGIEPQHNFAVLELGASAVGEIRNLAAIAQPEIGVVTALAPAHLQGFGSEEAIINAKGELVEALPKSGIAVLAGDDSRMRRIADRACCRTVFVGEHSQNDLQAEDVHVESNTIVFRLDRQEYELTAVGRHHLTAALTAIAVGREFGMSAESIARGLGTFQAAPGRCRLEQIGPWTVLDDSYNASPASMTAACEVLAGWSEPVRKLAVFGDMLELGEQAAEFHRAAGRQAASAGINALLAFGSHAADVVAGARDSGMDASRLGGFDRLDSLLALLDGWLEPGTLLLVKGSRSMRMERVVEWIRRRAENEFISKGIQSRPRSRVCA